MEAKIQKWGNSLGMRIPNNIIKELQLKTNDLVEIKYNKNQIIITKISPKISLEERIKAYHGENLSKNFSWDDKVGKELW